MSWTRGAPIRSATVVLGAIVSASILAWLAVTVAGFLRTGVYWRAHPEITFVAVYATVLLGELAILRTVGARLEARQLRPASWLVFLFLGALLALAAPGGIIYFLIPSAAVLIGIIVGRWYRPAELIGGLVGIFLLYVTWGELLSSLEELFSPGPLWIVAPVAAIMTVPVLAEAQPIFAGAQRRATLLGSACIALLAWAFTAAVPAYSQDHQQRFTIEHLTQFPSGESSWSILNDGASLPPAYSQYGPWHRGKLDFSERERWLAKAPIAPDIQAPSLEKLEVVDHGSERNIRLRVHSNGAERILLVAPAEAHIKTAGVAGFIRSIASDDSSGRFTIACTGRSCDGQELSIDLESAAPVKFTVIGARNGLPPTAAPLVGARPQFARPQYTPDETVAIAHVKL